MQRLSNVGSYTTTQVAPLAPVPGHWIQERLRSRLNKSTLSLLLILFLIVTHWRGTNIYLQKHNYLFFSLMPAYIYTSIVLFVRIELLIKVSKHKFLISSLERFILILSSLPVDWESIKNVSHQKNGNKIFKILKCAAMNYAHTTEYQRHLCLIKSLLCSERTSIVVSLIFGYSCPHVVVC